MVNTPEELRKKELEKQKEHEEIIRERASSICSFVNMEFLAGVNEGKITSKGGVVRYCGYLEASEIPVIVDYFAKKGWKANPEAKKEPSGVYMLGKEQMKTTHYFNIEPMTILK